MYVVAVIVAYPLLRVFTTPVLLTVATDVLLLFHVTVSTVLSGYTEAVSANDLPATVDTVLLLSFTLVGAVSAVT